MSYHVSSNVHRNLAASKRSIVIVCAGIALVLGTTSVGSSFIGGGELAPTGPNANSIPSDYDQITADEQPLLPISGRTLGRQESLSFGSTPLQTGRVGVEAGSASATAIITQINKRTQGSTTQKTPPLVIITPPPATPPAEEQQPAVATPPPTETPKEETPPRPPEDETPTDPPEEPPRDESSLLQTTDNSQVAE